LITQFANDTLPDYTTVTVYDVTNGEYMTSGENFVCTADGVHMYLDSMSANGSRSFTFEYYAQESVQASSNAIEVVYDYGIEKIDNDVYYHFETNWKNEKTYSFVGTLDIQLNFDTYPYIISKRSFEVYDNQNSRWLDRDEFAYSDGNMEISQDAMGTVDAGHSRVFDVFFQYVDEEIDDPLTVSEGQSSFLNTQVYGLFIYFHLIMIFIAGLGIACIRADIKKYTPMLYILAFIGFIITVMWLGGV